MCSDVFHLFLYYIVGFLVKTVAFSQLLQKIDCTILIFSGGLVRISKKQNADDCPDKNSLTLSH